MSIDARKIWTGEPDRDDHLRSADFLDVENHPEITFKGSQSEVIGANDYRVEGDLTIRGVTRKTVFDVRYLGSWGTPWWEDGEDKGPKTRAGFTAKARINRHDFGVSWSSGMEKGGLVVSNMVENFPAHTPALWL